MQTNRRNGLNHGLFSSFESPSNYSQPNVVTNKFTWTGSIRRQLTLIDDQGSNPGKPEIPEGFACPIPPVVGPISWGRGRVISGRLLNRFGS